MTDEVTFLRIERTYPDLGDLYIKLYTLIQDEAGDAPVTAVVGILEMLKLVIINELQEAREDDSA